MFGFGHRHHRGHHNEEIIINNGNGTTIIEERHRGLFGGRQEVIINNNNGRGGMGNTTIIEESGGFFGPREEIIVNNGGMMGSGNTTIIEERGGFFGPREQIIVNNGGMMGGGNTTIIEERDGFFGQREEIIVNNGRGGWGNTTIIEENNGFFGPREQIIVNNGMGGTTIIEDFGYGGEEIIINNNNGGGYGYNQGFRNQQGYNNQGYNQHGYNNQGYNQYGYNQYGYDQHGYNKHGYNKHGYNKYGYNQYGYDQHGYNKHGYDQHGYNKHGYNNQGYNQYGYHQQNSGQNNQRSPNHQQYQQQQQQPQQKNQQQPQQPQMTQQQPQQQPRQQPPQQQPQQQLQKTQQQQHQQQQKIGKVAQQPLVIPNKQSVISQKSGQSLNITQTSNSKLVPEAKINSPLIIETPIVQSKKQQVIVKNQIKTENIAQKSQQPIIQKVTPKKPIHESPVYPQICAFAYHFNRTLKNDPQLKGYVPMNPNTFFNSLQDGVIFCKFINFSVHKQNSVPIISPIAINIKPTTEIKAIQNLNMAIDCAKSLGCYMNGIKSNALFNKNEEIVLALAWQLILIHISHSITFFNYPEIILLKKQAEDEAAFTKISHKQIFMRWLNYHYLMQGVIDKTVTNLGKDLADSSAYGNFFANTTTFDANFWQKNNNERAKIIINTCIQNKVDTPIHNSDIVSGKAHLNTILCYDIFRTKHGLVVDIPESIKPQPETLKNREIQMFGNWINSLGLKGVIIHDFITDLKTGKVLLSIIDKLLPNTVDWNKRFSTKFNSRIHIIQNCNYVIELSTQKLGLKFVNISGTDIVDGKVNLVLGLVWQLCNIYWEKRVGKIHNQQLLKWANSKVSSQYWIKSLDDKSLSSGIYIMRVVEEIKPKTVDFTKIKDINSQPNRIANINYALACVRKLGAQVLALWEHVSEVDSRFIGLILAELRRIEQINK